MGAVVVLLRRCSSHTVVVVVVSSRVHSKVGAAISMAYVTGQPILFVGTGQTYKDLKRMNVKTLIRALLK